MKLEVIWKKKWIMIGGLSIGAGVLIICALTLWAQMQVNSCADKVYSELQKVPVRQYALVPGTARIVQGKFLNPYFQNRIDAAVKLYRTGKVKKILVSGDNSRADYNEPGDMKRALLECGIPEEDILQDFAGFRTLDSIVRARDVFQIPDCTVVSQHFHCKRAVYLAEGHGMTEVIGFAAEDVPVRFRVKRFFREPLACLKAWLDIHLLKTKPRFEK